VLADHRVQGVDANGDLLFAGRARQQRLRVLGKLRRPTAVAIGRTAL
jgi:hypothetical protein